MRAAPLAQLAALAVLTLAVGGAGAGEMTPSDATNAPLSAAAVAACIDEAEAARRQASELGAEWLATRDLIAQAREQAELGKLQRAVELADLARAQGELASAQAAREAEAWQQRVVR
jgi:hypothetical protein